MSIMTTPTQGKVEYGSGAYYDGEWFDDKENGRGTRLYK